MVAAGTDHTVLLKSDGSAVVVGYISPLSTCTGCKHCQIPTLAEGLSFTQAAAGLGHTVLLQSDGTAFAWGLDLDHQCRIPALEKGVIYTQVAAGHDHTVLLKSDGTAVACGSNDYGQCQIPELPVGVFYTQAAAGKVHTVLLKSDGTAMTVGGWHCRRKDLSDYVGGPDHPNTCKVPTLEPGITYTHAAAGHCHTVLLKSDGTAVAFGDAFPVSAVERFEIPPLPTGVIYTQAAAGLYHTVLLRSDGTAVAFGGARDANRTQCQIPSLPAGVTYTQVAAGHSHTVLLKSDGTAVAFGCNNQGQCEIPTLDVGVTYRQTLPVPRRIFQAHCEWGDEGILIRLLELSGKEYCHFTVPATEQLVAVQNRCMAALALPSGAVALPQGELLLHASLRKPTDTLEDLLGLSKRRRFT